MAYVYRRRQLIASLAATLTDARKPLEVRAIKLLIFQCCIFGGDAACMSAARAIATLSILQYLRRKGREDDKIAGVVLRNCFSQPNVDLIRTVCEIDFSKEFRALVSDTRLLENVIDFSWRFSRGSYKGGGGSTMARTIARQTPPYEPLRAKSTMLIHWEKQSSTAVFVYLMKRWYSDLLPNLNMESLGNDILRAARRIDYITEYFCAYNRVVADLRRCGYEYEEIEVREVPVRVPEPEPFPPSIVEAIENYDSIAELDPEPVRVSRKRPRSA